MGIGGSKARQSFNEKVWWGKKGAVNGRTSEWASHLQQFHFRWKKGTRRYECDKYSVSIIRRIYCINFFRS